MDELKCPICGEPTFVYYGNARKDRLCKKHASDLRAGLIAQCEKCGEWREADKPCPKCNPAKEAPTKVEQAKDAPKITCLLCGADSNGYHFCKSCYRKYKDRSVDIRITNCEFDQILDTYGNRTEKSLDGNWVRSKSEARICDWLFNHHIRYIYEYPVYCTDENEKEIVLHPDFYLVDSNKYIEFNGLTSEEYRKAKAHTRNIYTKLGYDVIYMEEKDIHDLDRTLKPALGIH